MTDEDWDFKVGDQLKKTKSPDSIKRKSSIKKKKRAPLKIDGTTSQEKKISRSALAKRDAAQAAYSELYPPGTLRRIKANLVDIIIISICVGVAIFLSPYMQDHIVEYVRKNNMNLPYSPEELIKGCIAGGSMALFFFFYVFPSMIFQKSPGKNMMLIRIGASDVDKFPSRSQILLREFILKPLSVISIFGVLIVFFNEKKRGLHDFLSGTALYLDD